MGGTTPIYAPSSELPWTHCRCPPRSRRRCWAGHTLDGRPNEGKEGYHAILGYTRACIKVSILIIASAIVCFANASIFDIVLSKM